jgi:hypothetical protein
MCNTFRRRVCAAPENGLTCPTAKPLEIWDGTHMHACHTRMCSASMAWKAGVAVVVQVAAKLLAPKLLVTTPMRAHCPGQPPGLHRSAALL